MSDHEDATRERRPMRETGRAGAWPGTASASRADAGHTIADTWVTTLMRTPVLPEEAGRS